MKEAQKKLLLDLAALLERHKVDIDMSKTYTEGICFELDCGGAFVCLPEVDVITPSTLRKWVEDCG